MKMETNIKQDLRRTYLIAEDRNMTNVDFRFKMLLSNNIRNLLRCTERNIDDRIRIYYDITDKICLKDYCIEEGIDGTIIKKLVSALMLLEEECRDYMMDIDNVSLNPEHVFLENGVVYFCYLPWKDGDIRGAFHRLIVDLMDIGNSMDTESLSLLYELHGITRKPYSLDEVMTKIACSKVPAPDVEKHDFGTDEESLDRQIKEAEKQAVFESQIKQDSYPNTEYLKENRLEEEAYQNKRIKGDFYEQDAYSEKKKRREERKEYRRQRVFERFLRTDELDEDEYDRYCNLH